ncbi:MAG: hypothetical protein ACJAYR_003571 [Sneathiella sp.]
MLSLGASFSGQAHKDQLTETAIGSLKTAHPPSPVRWKGRSTWLMVSPLTFNASQPNTEKQQIKKSC